MLLNAEGNPVANENTEPQPKAMTAEDLNLNYFDPEIVLRPLNGKTVCRCIALIQVGPDVPEAVIEDLAQKFWNYGIQEGTRKSGDVTHIAAARQALKDFLVAADAVYKILEDYTEPTEVDLTPEENNAEDD